MSTFLELVQEAHRESGASGAEPSAVLNQTGEASRLVNWVKLEYRKIQIRHSNWRWLRKGFTLATVASDGSYEYSDCDDDDTAAAITRFSRWYTDEFKIYLTSSGVGSEGWLSFWPWDTFKRTYRFGTQNDSSPVAISVDPANRLVLGPEPNDIYTISGDYQRGPQELTADADEPEMPERFHDLIWMGAVRRYAAYESAPEVWSEFKSQHSELMRSLEQDQLPEPSLGNPLC